MGSELDLFAQGVEFFVRGGFRGEDGVARLNLDADHFVLAS